MNKYKTIVITYSLEKRANFTKDFNFPRNYFPAPRADQHQCPGEIAPTD